MIDLLLIEDAIVYFADHKSALQESHPRGYSLEKAYIFAAIEALTIQRDKLTKEQS
jgi:hypothetical protein